MEENNRINRRSRPRPYDLRRKVLLKNFLREQMTYIPGTQTESVSQNDDANIVEEPSISLHLDEVLPELNDESTTSPAVVVNEQCSSDSTDDVESSPVITDSKDSIIENVKDSVTDTNSSDATHESSMYKFSSFLKLKRDSKKKQKGIVKAKEIRKSVKSPTKSRTFKSGLERVFYRHKKPSETSSQNPKSRNPPRSLFSLFKYRRSQRNTNELDRIKKRPCTDQKSFCVSTKYATLNQSVQTEDTWAREELYKVQQSNRLLREENRLLSESLSYFMSSSCMDLSQNSNSQLQSSNKNMFNTGYRDYFPSSNASSNWNPRTRIARSKSVQEHRERRNMLRNNYRTRSMNCNNIRNKFLLPDPKPHMSTFSTPNEEYNIPRIRRKNILANLPVNSASRGIQRRSSMPERILSENDRSIVCRRSGSFRDAYNRKPFYSLPSEAFY